MSKTRPLLLIILGPTAVGKTAFAIQLARQNNGEIISADSRLFYRGMDIGTAKPSLAERAEVPHHLIDVADPDENWSLAEFQRAALAAIDATIERGRLPLLVGGTGQYIRAISEGWVLPGLQPIPGLRQTLEDWGRQIGTSALHDRLETLDPEAAARIDPGNVRRTVRALEVIFGTGQLFSAQRRKSPVRYDVHQIGLWRPRAELYERIDLRVDRMISDGLIREVESLLAKGYSPELPSMSAIGYREICQHLGDESTLEEAIRSIKRRTRVFVRRQGNWFKRDDPQIRWLRAEERALKAAIELVEALQRA